MTPNNKAPATGSILGRLALYFWFRPKEKLQRCFSEGGPWQQHLAQKGHKAMAQAAKSLPAIPPRNGEPFELHLLTGARFWDQTAFCLYSLQLHCDRPIRPFIYDDGTLLPETCAHLQRIAPQSRFVSIEQIRKNLDALLPQSKFPYLRDRWEHYPNIRKLIDPHLGSSGWKLVIDSDLLFFRRPELLLRWSSEPRTPLHAIDVQTSYGYSNALLSELAQNPLAEKVNVGLCGLNSDELDWNQLEQWCAELIEREKTNYYLEQALVAMLVANRECTIAPAEDYITLPRPPEAQVCQAVMHHYVAESKRWYFQTNWRQFLRPNESR